LFGCGLFNCTNFIFGSILGYEFWLWLCSLGLYCRRHLLDYFLGEVPSQIVRLGRGASLLQVPRGVLGSHRASASPCGSPLDGGLLDLPALGRGVASQILGEVLVLCLILHEKGALIDHQLHVGPVAALQFRENELQKYNSFYLQGPYRRLPGRQSAAPGRRSGKCRRRWGSSCSTGRRAGKTWEFGS